MKFFIAVEETRSTVVEVEANTAEEAISKAEESYCNNDICLDSADYIDDGTCFYDETDRWAEAAEEGLVHFEQVD